MAKSECSLYSRMCTRKMWPFPALCAEIHKICPRLTLICKARPIRAQFECQQSEDPAYSGGYIHFGP